MWAKTHGLAFTSISRVPDVCLMVLVGHFEASAKLKQTFPPELILTFSVLVTGQLDTFVCNQLTLPRSRSGGTNDVLEDPVDEVLVVEAAELELVDAVLAVLVVLVVLVVFALSSTTPAEDFPAEHSKGQHQPSEQPLSAAVIAKMTLIRKSVAIPLKSQIS